MKQIENKILVILITFILVIGTIIVTSEGFKYELKYKKNQSVELNIGKEFQEEEVKEIVRDILPNQNILIQTVEIYKDCVNIVSDKITEEQKTEIVNKINEKYEVQLDSAVIEIEEQSQVKFIDIITPYIVPFAISTLLIIIFMMIRYFKLNGFDVLIKSIGIIGLGQLILFGIMAITKMPIGNLTLSSMILVYILSTYILSLKLNEDLEKKMN